MIKTKVYVLLFAMSLSRKNNLSADYTFMCLLPFRSLKIVIRLFEFPNIFWNLFSNSF